MGMDAVKLVMRYEEAFGISIPDSEAAQMVTPRHVVDHLLPRLGESEAGGSACLTARAFDQLRAQLVASGCGPRGALTPECGLVDRLGPENARDRWSVVQRRLGYERWPALRRRGRMLGWLGGVETVGDAARSMAVIAPRRLHPEPWTRAELEETLMRVTEDELGLDPGRFTVDSRFLEDMRID